MSKLPIRIVNHTLDIWRGTQKRDDTQNCIKEKKTLKLFGRYKPRYGRYEHVIPTKIVGMAKFIWATLTYVQCDLLSSL